MYPVMTYGSGRLFIATRSSTSWLFDMRTEVPTHLTVSSENKRQKKVDLEACGLVLAAAISKSGRYLALCTDFKEVFLYAVDDKTGCVLQIGVI